MALIADIILAAGSFGAAIYCLILSHRLRKFTNIESDIGKAINVLSRRIDDLKGSLQTAQKNGDKTIYRLSSASDRAEDAAKHLELLVASLHSLPQNEAKISKRNPFIAQRGLQGLE